MNVVRQERIAKIFAQNIELPILKDMLEQKRIWWEQTIHLAIEERGRILKKPADAMLAEREKSNGQ